MFGPPDFDDPDHYPHNGTLEEKAVFSLEQLRRQFYWQKRTYDANKEGGHRHTATLLATGPKTAESMAKKAEAAFRMYLSQAYLTEDGETTDPRYPVDKMINNELRRIRQVVILSVANFMYYFESMMPEDIIDWGHTIIYFNLDSYRHRYVNETYEDINIVIPNKKLPPRTGSALEVFLIQMSEKYSDPNVTNGLTKAYLIDRLRDDIIEFLLVDIPFNNKRLEAKTQLIADEIVPKETDDKPVLH